jgi:endonuclease/exonuclease/phosphatase family metal-dependent hydrolase
LHHEKEIKAMKAQGKIVKLLRPLLLRSLLFSLLFLLTHDQAFSQCRNDSSNTENLKIVSWNIYMLPHFWIHSGQLTRAKNISDAVIEEDADILVFQEAFDKKSREIIWENIKAKYPYQSGEPAKSNFWKINNGIWILSKIPITVSGTIFFRESRGADRFASKGAILVEAEKNNQCFQLIGTHLQSDLEAADVKATRHSQYRQIQEELMDAHHKSNVPQFVVGDFNTKRDDSVSYAQMIDVMKVKECPLEGDQCYSYDYSQNDFIRDQPGVPQLIDYVLYREHGERQVRGLSTVRVFQNKWSDRQADLSDHFAISAVINLK